MTPVETAMTRTPRHRLAAPILGLAVFALAVLAGVVLAPVAGARGHKEASVEELMNPLLGPAYALWLVGPIARLATSDEIAAYGRLTDDAAARAFIDEFWTRRDPEPAYPGNPARELFEGRAADADHRFAEAGIPGRRTDRGIVFVLYGAPEKEEFDISQHPDDPPILVWRYPADAAKGLDGKRPERFYRFIKRGEVTTFYTPNTRPPRPRPDRLDRPGYPPS
jgi:GWxTD domain-containing protein